MKSQYFEIFFNKSRLSALAFHLLLMQVESKTVSKTMDPERTEDTKEQPFNWNLLNQNHFQLVILSLIDLGYFSKYFLHCY
jgi:hypothetical protein